MENKDMLIELFKKQYKLQTQHMHYDFDNMSELERGNFIKDNTLYCDDELHEMLHEIPYFKAWKRYEKDPKKNAAAWHRAKEEFVDALHFFLNVAICLGFSADELFEMYSEKNSINIERQKDQQEYKPSADEA